MNRVMFCVVVMAIVASRAHAAAEDPDSTEFRTLGLRLVDSLKDDNLIAYAQCWLSGPVFVEINASIYVQTDEQIDELKTYMLKRDRKIASVYEPLRNQLQRLSGDISKISLHSVSAKDPREAQTKYGEKVFAMEDVTVTIQIAPDRLVRLDMDSADKFGGHWFFTDSPRTRIEFVKVKNDKEVEVTRIRLETETGGQDGD